MQNVTSFAKTRCVFIASGYETAGDADDVFYVCKDLYLCTQCFDAGGHKKHIRYLHICKRKDLIKLYY